MQLDDAQLMKTSASQGYLRIAFLLPSLHGGGTARAMLNLLHGLCRIPQLDLVLLLGQAQGAFLRMVPAQVSVVDMHASHMRNALPELVRYLRTAQPDVLISALDHTNVVVVLARELARTPTKLVLTSHVHLSTAIRSSHVKRDHLLPIVMRMTYRRADAIVAVSLGVADALAKTAGVPCERIIVIHNPVVDNALSHLAQEPLWEIELQEPQVPLVLSAGRLTTQQKDWPTLLRAFAIVRQQRLAKLAILGNGEERQALEGLVHTLHLDNEAVFLGFQSNPYKYMARADVFVLSSRSEGLPTVLIEAMACGAPVIATDCPLGPREILEDGRAGLLVPVGDPSKLAEAIVAVLDDPQFAQRLRAAGRQRAEDFRVEKAVAQYWNLITELCSASEQP